MNSMWKKLKISEREHNDMLVSSYLFRSRLTELIEDEIKSLDCKRDYEQANWHIAEADRKGQIHALNLIKKLIGE